MAKEIEVIENFRADFIHQQIRRFDQLAVLAPKKRVGQLLFLLGFEVELLFFAPGENLLFVGVEIVINRFAIGFVGPLHRLAQGFVEAQGFDTLGGKLGREALGAFDIDLVVAEVAVVEDFAGDPLFAFALHFPHLAIDLGDLSDMFGGEFAVFVAQVFAELAVEPVGVDELDFAPALRGFVVAQYPDVGGDAGVVEEVVG